MRSLRSVLRCIEKLEKLPQFQPLPSPWEKNRGQCFATPVPGAS